MAMRPWTRRHPRRCADDPCFPGMSDRWATFLSPNGPARLGALAGHHEVTAIGVLRDRAGAPGAPGGLHVPAVARGWRAPGSGTVCFAPFRGSGAHMHGTLRAAIVALFGTAMGVATASETGSGTPIVAVAEAKTSVPLRDLGSLDTPGEGPPVVG